MTRRSPLEELREDVQRKRAEWLKARAELIAKISEDPGQIPQPDGTLRIVQAGRKQLTALQHYKDAFDRYTSATIERTGGRSEPDPGI